ncbi:MAG: cobalamin biosynthesis protein CobQ, partial [Chloroflexi bacterium]|nr:cobalamin biosynthesis protein CobQ [Chloroflexota bacterium]
LHTAVDIFTHADDGPVLTFPLDWHTRFKSPISYWDPAHYGRLVRLLEHLLDLLLVVWLLWRRR